MHVMATAEDCADIAAEEVRACLLCSRQGSLLYEGLRDRTFGAPGEWNYHFCSACELIWLSLRPQPRDLAHVYQSYYTHEEQSHDPLRYKLKMALIARVLKSEALSPGPSWSAVASVLGFFPPFSESALMGSMLLGGNEPGRLLDIGCGSGEFLAMMRQAGWDVSGIEPDARAASLASKKMGAVIPTVELHEANFKPGTFDTITMHHVIEHVYDPVGLMQECRRLLRPDGRVVIVTPNINSLGHRYFRDSWRGLEPPRHMYLFSPNAIRKSICQAGLRLQVLRTSARMGRAIWSESLQIKNKKGSIGAPFFQAFEQVLCEFQSDFGEELIAVASPEKYPVQLPLNPAIPTPQWNH